MKNAETKAGDPGNQNISELLISKSTMQTKYSLEILHSGPLTNTLQETTRGWKSQALFIHCLLLN